MRKLGLMGSIPWFILPGAILGVNVAVFMPLLVSAGWLPFQAFAWLFFIAAALLFPLTFIVYRLEGNAWTWKALGERFWLRRLRLPDWLWTAGLVVFYYATFLLLKPVADYLALHAPLCAPPASLPELYHPFKTVSGGVPSVIGGFALKGQYWLIPLMFIFTNLNGFGFALWQRGLLLPRQEAAIGKPAWMVNGVLSALMFSLIFPWRILQVLPVYLLMAFVTQVRKNQWPSLILIAVDGLQFTLLIAAGVMG